MILVPRGIMTSSYPLLAPLDRVERCPHTERCHTAGTVIKSGPSSSSIERGRVRHPPLPVHRHLVVRYHEPVHQLRRHTAARSPRASPRLRYHRARPSACAGACRAMLHLAPGPPQDKKGKACRLVCVPAATGYNGLAAGPACPALCTERERDRCTHLPQRVHACRQPETSPSESGFPDSAHTS